MINTIIFPHEQNMHTDLSFRKTLRIISILNEPYFLLKVLLDMVIDLRKNFKFCNIYTENFLQVLLHALALCLHPHNWTELMKNTEAH